jgi:hypothetical protein
MSLLLAALVRKVGQRVPTWAIAMSVVLLIGFVGAVVWRLSDRLETVKTPQGVEIRFREVRTGS